MKIEIKAVRTNEKLSRETTNFSASLYVDGERIGMLSNDGGGGADRFDPIAGKVEGDGRANRKIYEDACKWVTTQPLVTLPHDRDVEMNMELYIGELIEDKAYRRDLRRILRGNKIPLAMDGYIYTYPGNLETAKDKYPDAVFLSELSFEEALRIYKESE